jgi:hypothetical protein
VSEALESQIDRLAKWIMENAPGEPHTGEGAVDTAIHIMSLGTVVDNPPSGSGVASAGSTQRERPDESRY